MVKPKRKWMKYDHYGYLFIAPFFLAYFLFHLYPMMYTIGLSFTDVKGMNQDFQFVGLQNYAWLWGNEYFWHSMYNTAIMWIINFIPQLGFALLFAAIFASKHIKVRGKQFFKVIFYMPNIIMAASVALLFGTLFAHPFGTFTIIFKELGLVSESFQFLRDEWATRLLVCFIQFLIWTGPTTIMLAAGMTSVNNSLYESAMLDGATSRQMFFRITVPLIKPIMLYTLVTSLVGGLQVFDIPFLLNNGGPLNATTTIAVYTYKLAFTGDNNFSGSAAGSVYLMLIAIACSFALFKMMGAKNT